MNGTKFGLVQQAIRDGENRVLFSGYATANYKLFVFVAAAMIAAVGGALFVPQAGIINPNQMTTDKSIEAVIWVAVGGRGTLIGPIIGAIGVNALKSWATHAYPNSWLIILGVIALIVVMFLPGGVVSLPAKLTALWHRRQAGGRAGRGRAETRPRPSDEQAQSSSSKMSQVLRRLQGHLGPHVLPVPGRVAHR